jgi:Pectate lyase superfamily protein
MPQLFDVRDFGAVGTGTANSPSDDTAAINRAISAANADGGGIVFFPRGVYRVTSTIHITTPHITLRGVGGGLDPNIVHNGGLSASLNAAPSRLLWGGASGNGQMTDLQNVLLKFDVGQAPAPLNTNTGGGVEDLVLDGNSKCQHHIHVSLSWSIVCETNDLYSVQDIRDEHWSNE